MTKPTIGRQYRDLNGRLWEPVFQSNAQTVYRSAVGNLIAEPDHSEWTRSLTLVPRKIKRWVLSVSCPSSDSESVRTWIYSDRSLAEKSDLNGPLAKIHEIEIEV